MFETKSHVYAWFYHYVYRTTPMALLYVDHQVHIPAYNVDNMMLLYRVIIHKAC